MKIDYNNIGVGTIAIGAVLSISKELSVAKATLVMPFITHKESLYYLARATTKVPSIEKLIAEKTSYFSNFNARYYDALTLSFSSIQYLTEMGYARLEKGILYTTMPIEYDTKMGTRAKKIFQASNNVSAILKGSDKTLYLNLRIQI